MFWVQSTGGVADAHNFGDRKPPSAAYATFSPVLHFDATEGLFIGGNFWNGRATGWHYVGDPADPGDDNPDLQGVSPTAAQQALGPFLNTAEHNAPSELYVLGKISNSRNMLHCGKLSGAHP